ncbi:MAG: 30S ribosomal protein S1 [Trueperaceae bacterium]|nr:30S ribosomal protein S1 [Trueperaceae bacterium]
MDQKPNQAADAPAPATDPAIEPTSHQDPNTDAEQGTGTVAAETQDHEVSSSEAAPQNAEGSEEVHDEAEAPESVASEPATVEAAPNEAAPTEAATADDAAVEAASTEGAPLEAAPTEVTGEAPGAQVAQDAASQDVPSSDAEPTPVAHSSYASMSDDEITMEDVMAASDEQLARKPVHRGMITTGEVIMLSQDGIVVDVGAKIEGLLPYNQLFEHDSNAEEAAQYFKSGDPITVYVVRSDVPNNTIVLSKRRADAERAWNLLQEVFEKEKPVEVEIVEKVRGGLVASLGVRAFLPASQVDIRRVNDLSPYVGQRMRVRIIELNRRRNRVIISRRAILETEIAEQKGETLKHLEPGYKTDGEVVEITDFGVFVNLGGIDGLVHRSELTHGRFNHPRDVVKVGDKVKVEVLDMDLERERINLSMKSLLPNPWENVLTNYVIGQRVSGKVTNLTPFGAFVEIEPGLEGLIHVSEMSWTKRVRHPKEIVTEGDDVETMILKIDTQQQRISLGLRQTQPDPWSSLPDRFPPGTEVTGPITGITDFGVFMEIEEGIEGLVHISELSHDHIEDVNEHFKRGDEVTAVILNIDPVEQRASLSRKRLLPFTAAAGSFDEYGGAANRGQGGGAGRGPGAGRRGGRRSKGIDYDYSYAAAEAGGGKPTTKLGDVYADLFAQFGLSDFKEEKKEEEPAASEDATAKADAQTEASAEAPQPAASETPAADAAAVPVAQVEPETKPEPVTSDEEPVDPENSIDAAEAAAMLTAAFRSGKRPQRPADETAETAAAPEDTASTEDAEADEAANVDEHDDHDDHDDDEHERA